MRHRISPYGLVLAAAAALFALGLVVWAAESAAGAEPDVCDFTHRAPGTSHNGEWGTITSDPSGVTYDLEDGWAATICVKAGAGPSGGGTTTTTVTGAGHVATPGGHDLSHWSVTLAKRLDPTTTTTTEVPPSSTTTTSPPTSTTEPPSTTTTTSPPTTTETTVSSTTTPTTTPPATSTTAPTTSTTEDDPEEPPASTSPSSPPPTELPRTGASAATLATAALALLGIGGTAVAATRRR